MVVGKAQSATTVLSHATAEARLSQLQDGKLRLRGWKDTCHSYMTARTGTQTQYLLSHFPGAVPGLHILSFWEGLLASSQDDGLALALS